MCAMIHTCAHTMNTYNIFKKKQLGKLYSQLPQAREADLGGPAEEMTDLSGTPTFLDIILPKTDLVTM